MGKSDKFYDDSRALSFSSQHVRKVIPRDHRSQNSAFRQQLRRECDLAETDIIECDSDVVVVVPHRKKCQKRIAIKHTKRVHPKDEAFQQRYEEEYYNSSIWDKTHSEVEHLCCSQRNFEWEIARKQIERRGQLGFYGKRFRILQDRNYDKGLLFTTQNKKEWLRIVAEQLEWESKI